MFHLSVAMAWVAATVLGIERALQFGLLGWLIAVPLWLVVTYVALRCWGSASMGSQTRELLRTREAASQAHQGHGRDRRQLAERSGMGYEETSIELAELFGRLDQPVPIHSADLAGVSDTTSVEEVAQQVVWWLFQGVVLTHAAELRAESVIRTQVAGCPLVVFDLELVMQHTSANLTQVDFVTEPELRAELTKQYLTLWVVTLPVALPFVSSTFAFELAAAGNGAAGRPVSYLRLGPSAAPAADPDQLAWQATAEGHGFWTGDQTDQTDQEEARRQRIGLMTGDEQCARLLMSVPAVRAAALSPQQPPFFIDGNRLVVSDLSPRGASAAEVERVMAGLAELVPALPWPELARYRIDGAGDRPPDRRGFHLTYRVQDEPDLVLEQWVPATSYGLRWYERSHQLTWRSQPEPGPAGQR